MNKVEYQGKIKLFAVTLEAVKSAAKTITMFKSLVGANSYGYKHERAPYRIPAATYADHRLRSMAAIASLSTMTISRQFFWKVSQ